MVAGPGRVGRLRRCGPVRRASPPLPAAPQAGPAASPWIPAGSAASASCCSASAGRPPLGECAGPLRVVSPQRRACLLGRSADGALLSPPSPRQEGLLQDPGGVPRRLHQGHQEGLSETGAAAPSRQEPRRPPGAGEVPGPGSCLRGEAGGCGLPPTLRSFTAPLPVV